MTSPADYHFPYDLDAAFIAGSESSSEQLVERRADDSCFLSIRFPNESRLRAPGALLDNIRSKPTPSELFHLTLLYAEHCSDDQLAMFLANLSPTMPFSIEVIGLKLIEAPESPVLVWGVDPGPVLGRLQAELYNAVINEDMVISPFSKPGAWLPHITIAYDLDGALDPKDFPQIEPFRLMVNSFAIGRSYDDYFEVNFPRGIGDQMFVERHSAPRPPEERNDENLEDPVSVQEDVVKPVERTRHGIETKISVSQLAKLVHGGQIVKGALRRMTGLDDGPFVVERADGVVPGATPSSDSGARGAGGSKQDGSKVGMKKQETGFNADGKKRKFGLPHHRPIEFDIEPDLNELLDATPEWDGGAKVAVDGLLRDSGTSEEGREGPAYDEKIRPQLVEWFDNPDSENPLTPSEMADMNDEQIQIVLDRAAEAEAEDQEAEPQKNQEASDARGRARSYMFGRDDDEIVAVAMATTVAPDDYRLGILADGAQDQANYELKGQLTPSFRPENYDDEDFETGYIYVDWLAVKEANKGYGPQLLGEIFREAAAKNRGVFLEAAKAATEFYKRFDVNQTTDATVFWTAEDVKGWAELVEEEGAVIVEREDIQEVLFGTDQPEVRPVDVDDDAEPLGGGYTMGNVLWIEKPRPWKRQFKDQIDAAEYMTDEDATLLEDRKPFDQRFPDERETMLQGVQRAMNNLVGSIFARRHGEGHVGQEGRPPEKGGSKPGYEHAGASSAKDGGSEPSKSGALVKAVPGWTTSKPWQLGKEDLAPGKVPGIEYDPTISPHLAAHARKRDRITVGPNWFKGSDESRILNLYHEVGHRVASRIIASGEWEQILEPFKEGRDNYDNFAGFNNKPEEFLSDVYSELIVGGKAGYESEKYIRVFEAAEEAASEIGLPSEALFGWEGTGETRRLVQHQSEQIFHGTGAEAAKSIMESGLLVNFADDDNFESNVIYASEDRGTAELFASRSSEEKYAIITMSADLIGSEPRIGAIGITFSEDIPPEAITKIEIYERGYQAKDDKLIETVERSGKEPSHLYVAAEITDAGEYSILGPTEGQEAGLDAELDEEEVVENYKVSAYSINRLLRGEEVEHSDDPDDIQAQIDVLDGIMQREDSVLDQDMVLYRGMDLDDQFSRNFDDLEEEIFGYDGYTSASSDQNQPLAREADSEEKPALVQILAPEGTRAFSLSEQEILLDRGFQFRVTETKEEGDLRTIVVEVIPQSSANSGGNRALSEQQARQEEEEEEAALLEERAKRDDKKEVVKEEGDTSQKDNTSQIREVSTDVETGSERRDYWVWEKGEVTLLDREDFGKSQEAGDRQAEEFSENVPEEDEEEEAVERVVGPLRRVVIERHGKHIGQEGRPGEPGGAKSGFKHEEGSVGGTTDTDPTKGGGKAGVSTNRRAVKANEFLKRFQVAMKDNERAAYVTEYTVEELEGMQALYLSEDGKAGFAVLDRGDGDIEATGAFNRGSTSGIVLEMIKESIDKDGVNYAEAFGPLQDHYAKIGFEVDDVLPFDPDQAPPNWNTELHGKPNYYIMRVRK